MERKEFIKTCGFACLGLSGLSAVLQGCVSARSINGQIEGSYIVFPEKDFEYERKGEIKKHKYLIVNHDALQFPICVFRLEDNNYSAVLMKCSHQGAELQVFGEKLQCPAHGSEFSNQGKVLSAPAEHDLRKFAVETEKNIIKINLK